jgi:hypothetical protein
VNDLDGKGSAAAGQFLLGDLVGREQGALTTDKALECRTGALADAEDGEFGVETRSLLAAALAGAEGWSAVKGREIEDEAAEQAKSERTRLGFTERPWGRGYFFFAASARGCWEAAWARREATN